MSKCSPFLVSQLQWEAENSSPKTNLTSNYHSMVITTQAVVSVEPLASVKQCNACSKPNHFAMQNRSSHTEEVTAEVNRNPKCTLYLLPYTRSQRKGICSFPLATWRTRKWCIGTESLTFREYESNASLTARWKPKLSLPLCSPSLKTRLFFAPPVLY